MGSLIPWIALANPANAEVGDEKTIEPLALSFALFLIVTSVQQVFNQLVVIPINTLINSSVDKAYRARAMGLAMAVQSLCMAATPTLAGTMLSASVLLSGEMA